MQQDYVRAYMWFSLASSSSTKPLGYLAEERDKLMKKMTAAQKAEARKLAREWKP